jgi:hypothetical protein
MSKLKSRRPSRAQNSSGTEKLAAKLVDLAVVKAGSGARAELLNAGPMVGLYVKALDAIVAAGDRAGTALTLIGMQSLRWKTPSEVVEAFSVMASELRPQVDLVGEQF